MVDVGSGIGILAAAVVTTAGSASNGTESYDVVIANGRVMDPESGLMRCGTWDRRREDSRDFHEPLQGKKTIDAMI